MSVKAYASLVAGSASRTLSTPAATREGKWLELLAWCAATMRELRVSGLSFPTEHDQRLVLHAEKRLQIGRIPDSDWAIDMSLASRSIWAAREYATSCMAIDRMNIALARASSPSPSPSSSLSSGGAA